MLLSAVIIAFLILWIWALLTEPPNKEIPYRPPTLEYEVERIPKLKNAAKYLGTFTLTAYCPCEKCSAYFGSSTATGTKAKEGVTIAVDPKVTPYGSLLYIEEVGYRVAEDTGGAIKGNKIDVYFNSHEDALAFGIKKNRVFILGK